MGKGNGLVIKLSLLVVMHAYVCVKERDVAQR